MIILAKGFSADIVLICWFTLRRIHFTWERTQKWSWTVRNSTSSLCVMWRYGLVSISTFPFLFLSPCMVSIGSFLSSIMPLPWTLHTCSQIPDTCGSAVIVAGEMHPSERQIIYNHNLMNSDPDAAGLTETSCTMHGGGGGRSWKPPWSKHRLPWQLWLDLCQLFG